MKYKALISFVIVAGMAIFFLFLKKSAADAEKRSGYMLEEFKKVDDSLTKSGLDIDFANKKLLDSIAAKLSK
jgi:preprotein translocase subunit YajC